MCVLLLHVPHHPPGQNSNFPWNPQFLADFKNLILFSTQNEKLGRMELVPSRSERKSWSVIFALLLFLGQEACLLGVWRRQKRADALLMKIFFLRYLNGTNSILPNFSFWVEKSPIWPKSAKNCGFQGKFEFWPGGWWGTCSAAHTLKNRKIFFLRYLHGTKTSLPNFSSWVEKSIGWMDSAKNGGFQGRF